MDFGTGLFLVSILDSYCVKIELSKNFREQPGCIRTGSSIIT